jgi:putative heme transporter
VGSPPGRPPPAILSLCNWLLDVACLVLVIRATGSPVPWHGLLLAYGAGIVAGSIWPAPGGIGAVEAAMAAGLVAAGMQAGIALTAVLVYRLLSFWLLLGIGWIVMAVLARHREPVALAAL